MTQKSLQDKEKKFLFNMHNFDDDFEEEAPEEEVPPPPVFSEQELEGAKKQAYAQGKKEGISETEQSETRQIGRTLEHLSSRVQTLFESESQRERTFEKEVIALTLEIFQKLFPIYNENAGFAELAQCISETLKKQEGQKNILIQVCPAELEGIKQHLSQMKFLGRDYGFSVEGEESLSPGACKISWADGGALRDLQAVSGEIQSLMQQILAGRAAKGHDRQSDITSAAVTEKPDE